MNKILIVIFTLLFIFLTFEAGFMLGMNKMQSQNLSNTNETIERSSSINSLVKNLFLDGQNKKLDGLNLTYSYSGTLEKLEFRPEKIQGDFSFTPKDVAASLFIKTKDKTVRKFYFFEAELERFSYYEKSKDGDLIKIQPGEMTAKDRVSFTTTINLLQPPSNNLVEVVLVKNP